MANKYSRYELQPFPSLYVDNKQPEIAALLADRYKREVVPTQAFLDLLSVFYVPYGTGGGFLAIRYNPVLQQYQQGTLFGGWQVIGWNNAAYFNQDVSGWTISYYPEMGFWGSFHDYIPYHYFKDSKYFYSLITQLISLKLLLAFGIIKKIVIIILLFLPIVSFAQDYYVYVASESEDTVSLIKFDGNEAVEAEDL